MAKEDLRGRAYIPFPYGFEDFILNKSMTLLIKKMKKLKNKLQKQKVKCQRFLNRTLIKESLNKKGFFTV
jgi:hypothetical protein